MSKLSLVGLVFAALLPTASLSSAQTFPSRTVSIVVPFPAGGTSDVVARVLGDKLSRLWNQQVIVQNRPGAGGVVGTASVARSAPDGYTLLLASNSHVLISSLYRNINFDPVKDFVGITRVANVPLVAIVPADLRVTSFKEFINLANERCCGPGMFIVASAGVGSPSYLSAELLLQNEAKVRMNHVSYRGAPEAVAAVLRGEAQLTFAPISLAREQGAAGKVKLFAVTSSQRAPQLPDVPTIAEAALPGYTFDSWYGLLAPAGTPQPIVAKINEDSRAALQDPEVANRLMSQGAIPAPDTPQHFGAMIAADVERYGKLLREAGVTPN
jgi:tripartite-type tricarboxylate transporter receptor subunit TctC